MLDASRPHLRGHGPGTTERSGKRPLDTWFYPTALGQPLPTLPIWLDVDLGVFLDLEASYEETCRVLRIPLFIATLARMGGIVEEDLSLDETTDEVMDTEDAEARACAWLQTEERTTIQDLLKKIAKIGTNAKARALKTELERAGGGLSLRDHLHTVRRDDGLPQGTTGRGVSGGDGCRLLGPAGKVPNGAGFWSERAQGTDRAVLKRTARRPDIASPRTWSNRPVTPPAPLLDIDEVAAEALEMPDLPPPVLTLSDLDLALNHPGVLPPGVEWRRLDVGSYGLRLPGMTEEAGVTTRAEIFDDHFESHQFLSPGGCLFERIASQAAGDDAEGVAASEGRVWMIEGTALLGLVGSWLCTEARLTGVIVWARCWRPWATNRSRLRCRRIGCANMNWRGFWRDDGWCVRKPAPAVYHCYGCVVLDTVLVVGEQHAPIFIIERAWLRSSKVGVSICWCLPVVFLPRGSGEPPNWREGERGMELESSAITVDQILERNSCPDLDIRRTGLE